MSTRPWLVLSDVHERLEHLAALAPELARARGVILSGDLTMFGGAREAAEVVARVRGACSADARLLAVPGNTDHPSVLAYLEAEELSLHGRAAVVDGVAFYGVGGANPTPFGTPFELGEDALDALLRRGLDALRGHRGPRVLISHPPPLSSGVDRLRSGRPVGSDAVRRHVEETRPSLVACGHIHEGRGAGGVAGVPVLNPGPFAGGGFLRLTLDRAGTATGTVERAPVPVSRRAWTVVKGVGHKVTRLPRMRRDPSREPGR